MDVSFEGIGEWCATFLGSDLKEGDAVKVSASGTVALCGDGEDFCGVVRKGGKGSCCVQLGGLLRLRYSGSAPRVGLVSLAGDGKGGVRTVTAGGQRVLSVAVDTAGGYVTIKL